MFFKGSDGLSRIDLQVQQDNHVISRNACACVCA